MAVEIQLDYHTIRVGEVRRVLSHFNKRKASIFTVTGLSWWKDRDLMIGQYQVTWLLY